MEIQYIFIKKTESVPDVRDSNKFFQNMFKIVFEAVTFDTFQVTINGSSHKVTYRSSMSNNDVMYLTIF